MESALSGWNELGVVGTIYEDEDEDLSSGSTLLSPHRKNSWSLAIGREPDVMIHVQDSCFRLHKEPLTARSTYLRRRLTEISEITLSPPLNLTAQTFSLVADFCYGGCITVTPFNVAALRTAAELLGMMEVAAPGDENLKQKTEAYFRRAVTVNKEWASIVLLSCFPLLPEAETEATLVSRCIEALSLAAGSGGDVNCLDGFRDVRIEDLQLILQSLSQRLTDCHDFLYRIVDIYLEENSDNVSEDEKTRMCNYIDCSILSPRLLMHAVQNPRMPLRFVIQAMFMEQLHTRHSITSEHRQIKKQEEKKKEEDPVTLGAMLQQSAALRQVAQMKAVMSATNSRIQTLEKELSDMRELLNQSESFRSRNDLGRSRSFRLGSERNNKVERGQIGSISSMNVRDVKPEWSSSSEESSELRAAGEMKFGRRMIRGLRSALGLQKKGERKVPPVKVGKNGGNLEDPSGIDRIVVIKKDQPFQMRRRSDSQF